MLEEVSFGSAFDRDVEGTVWPRGLRRLLLGARFNRNVERVVWPAGLEQVCRSIVCVCFVYTGLGYITDKSDCCAYEVEQRGRDMRWRAKGQTCCGCELNRPSLFHLLGMNIEALATRKKESIFEHDDSSLTPVDA